MTDTPLSSKQQLDDEHVAFFREVVQLQKAVHISAPHMHGMLAAYDLLSARCAELDPDPVVCGCREANCPHTPIAKLPRQGLVDHYKGRIHELTARVAELEEQDVVPRSRYDACNSDWLKANEAVKKLTKTAEQALDERDRLRAALKKCDTDCDMAPYTTCSAQGPKFRCRSCIAREALVGAADEALCPHGFVLADNVCGPCSEGRPNRRAADDETTGDDL